MTGIFIVTVITNMVEFVCALFSYLFSVCLVSFLFLLTPFFCIQQRILYNVFNSLVDLLKVYFSVIVLVFAPGIATCILT